MESRTPFPISRYFRLDKVGSYYAYGNTPAQNFLHHCHGVKQPSVLLLGSGDIRSCFYTISQNLDIDDECRKHFEGVDFVLNDFNPAIAARNILFLHLCIQTPIEIRKETSKWLCAVWAIWFSHELRPEHEAILVKALACLIKFSESTASWVHPDNHLSKLVKFSSPLTLSKINQVWTMWHSGEIKIDRKDMYATRLKNSKLQNEFSISELSLMVIDTCIYLNYSQSKLETMKSEVRSYFKTGIWYAESVLFDSDEAVTLPTSVNVTLFDCKDGVYKLSIDAIPLQCFYLAYEFSPKNVHVQHSSQLFVQNKAFECNPILANCVQQFFLWFFSSAKVLKKELKSKQSMLSFTFDCSHALKFCQQIHDNGLILTNSFDVVSSSNLIDHVSLSNLVLSAIPLIKPTGYLLTTSLRNYKLVTSTTEEFLSTCFGFNCKLLPIILGIRCINFEGTGYCSPTSAIPTPCDYARNYHEFVKRPYAKNLIWLNVPAFSLKPCSLQTLNELITALCDTTRAALIYNELNYCLRHVCSETAIRCILAFASNLDADIEKATFWTPLCSKLKMTKILRPFLHCLQTQAFLHSLHIHLVVSDLDCPICRDIPLSKFIGQFCLKLPLSIIGPQYFLVYVHKDYLSPLSLQMSSTDVHIIDCFDDVEKGNEIILYFYAPLSFIKQNYSLTLVGITLNTSHTDGGAHTYITGNVSDFLVPIMKSKKHSFSTIATLVTEKKKSNLCDKLIKHIGDGDSFDSVISLGDEPSSTCFHFEQVTPEELKIINGSNHYVISYPYPIDRASVVIKYCDKERVIMVHSKRGPQNLADEKSLLVVCADNRLSHPVIELDDRTANIYCEMQFSQKECRILTDQCLVSLKKQLRNLFLDRDSDCLILTRTNDYICAMIIIHDRIFDLEHKTPAIDLSFCFMNLSVQDVNEIIHQCSPPIRTPRSCTVNIADLELLKKVFNHFSHHTLTKSRRLKNIRSNFLRAVVYPLYADPDTVDYNYMLYEVKASKSSATTSTTSKQNSKCISTETAVEDKCTLNSICGNCGKCSDNLKKCTGCHATKYCGKECQKEHWKIHKVVCSRIQSLSTSSGNKGAQDSLDSTGASSDHKLPSFLSLKKLFHNYIYRHMYILEWCTPQLQLIPHTSLHTTPPMSHKTDSLSSHQTE